MNVKNFNDWVLEESKKLQGTPLEIMSNVTATRNLAEALINKEGFTEDEKLCFLVLKESNTSLYEWDNLNEGLMDKLKEVGSKAIKGGTAFLKDVKDTIGREITGLPEFFKALASGVKNLANYIANFFKNVLKTMFGKPYEWVKAALGANFTKLENKVKEVAETEGSKLKKEAEGVTAIVQSVPKILSPKEIGDDVEKAISNSDSKDVPEEELAIVEESIQTSILVAMTEAVKSCSVEEIKEGFNSICSDAEINESDGHFKIPFVTKMSEILEKMPPFSWLSALAEKISTAANLFLTDLSALMVKKGAVKQAVEFTIMGALVGLGLEYMIKSQAKSAIAVLFPPLHSVLLVLGGIATAICVVHIASQVIDGLKDDVHNMDQSAANVAH